MRKMKLFVVVAALGLAAACGGSKASGTEPAANPCGAPAGEAAPAPAEGGGEAAPAPAPEGGGGQK